MALFATCIVLAVQLTVAEFDNLGYATPDAVILMKAEAVSGRQYQHLD
jgi:hypothetical protein